MKAFKIIGNCCLALVCVVSIAIIIAFFYYKNFVTKTSLGVNNIGDQQALDLKPIDIQKKEELPPAKQSKY